MSYPYMGTAHIPDVSLTREDEAIFHRQFGVLNFAGVMSQRARVARAMIYAHFGLTAFAKHDYAHFAIAERYKAARGASIVRQVTQDTALLN
jgi:hypothetical protein